MSSIKGKAQQIAKLTSESVFSRSLRKSRLTPRCVMFLELFAMFLQLLNVSMVDTKTQRVERELGTKHYYLRYLGERRE